MQSRRQDVDAGHTEGLESREVYHIVSLTPQWRSIFAGCGETPMGYLLVSRSSRFQVAESREQDEAVAVDEEVTWRLVADVVRIFQISSVLL